MTATAQPIDATFQPLHQVRPVSTVHPIAPLVRLVAVALGSYLAFRLTGALADGSILLDAGARGVSRMVELTNPVALGAFALCLYPPTMGLAALGLKPDLLGKRFAPAIGIALVVVTFAAYLVLNSFM